MPGYSNPLDEQTFHRPGDELPAKHPEWKDTAVIIAYDDSDGWYDHQMSPIVNQSSGSRDALVGPGSCGDGRHRSARHRCLEPHAQGRCGFGPRLPLMVISPWAKSNFVDHSLTNQARSLRFIEDNWLGGKRLGRGFVRRHLELDYRHVRF